MAILDANLTTHKNGPTTDKTASVLNYTLFHEKISKFFSNIIGLPECRNKRKSVLEITKMYYF